MFIYKKLNRIFLISRAGSEVYKYACNLEILATFNMSMSSLVPKHSYELSSRVKVPFFCLSLPPSQECLGTRLVYEVHVQIPQTETTCSGDDQLHQYYYNVFHSLCSVAPH